MYDMQSAQRVMPMALGRAPLQCTEFFVVVLVMSWLEAKERKKKKKNILGINVGITVHNRVYISKQPLHDSRQIIL